jgi:hypothetical protein
MSDPVIEEKLFAAVVELCDILGKPSFARDIAAACEMATISGRRIAVAGLVKRGKSTFVNRVIGRELSPVNLLPETSSVLCFSGGNKLRASGISFDGKIRKLSTKPHRFSKDVNREARRPLLAASYRGLRELPANFCLVDTPGAYETEVVANSLVESGMPSSLFHLCGGFIVVMGVPGLSAVDLQLLQRINESAGQLPVRVLLKGLDSSISQTELLEYSKEVLSEVRNEIYVVTDDNFDEASQLIDSFSISYFDHPIDAHEVSQLVVKMVFAQISEVLNTRDELKEIVAPKSLLKNLPPDLAEGVRFFAPGAREKRKKAIRKEKINDYKSELYAWKITNNELRSDIGLCDNEVRQAESNIRKHKHAPVPGFFFDIFASSAAQNRYRAVENSLNAKLSTAKTNASTARKLYENHQNLKPNRPL